MAVNRRRTVNDVAYGLGNPSQVLATRPIISNRNPTSNDNAPLGTLWCNKIDDSYYVLTSVFAGSANWEGQLPINGTMESLTLTGSGTALNVTTGNMFVNGDLSVGGNIALAGVSIISGVGSPNGSVSADQGSLYLRTDGNSTSTRMYINTNGSTTWTNVVTAA